MFERIKSDFARDTEFDVIEPDRRSRSSVNFTETKYRNKRHMENIVTELMSYEFKAIELNIERLLVKDLRNQFTFALDDVLTNNREGAFSVRDLGSGNYEINQHTVLLKPYLNHSEDIRKHLKTYLPNNMTRLAGICFAENRNQFKKYCYKKSRNC